MTKVDLLCVHSCVCTRDHCRSKFRSTVAVLEQYCTYIYFGVRHSKFKFSTKFLKFSKSVAVEPRGMNVCISTFHPRWGCKRMVWKEASGNSSGPAYTQSVIKISS
jgi:hypothetical protein